MCSHCTDANHEAPTTHDLTAADVELFNHDARKHAQRRAEWQAAGIPLPTIPDLAAGFHDAERCEIPDCHWCKRRHRFDRLWGDSRDEREYDRRSA